MEVMFLLLHWQQATKSMQTWNILRNRAPQSYMYTVLGQTWLALTLKVIDMIQGFWYFARSPSREFQANLWNLGKLLLYNLQLDKMTGTGFRNSLYSLDQSEKRQWVQYIIYGTLYLVNVILWYRCWFMSLLLIPTATETLLKREYTLLLWIQRDSQTQLGTVTM